MHINPVLELSALQLQPFLSFLILPVNGHSLGPRKWKGFLGSENGVRLSGSPAFATEIQLNISEFGAMLWNGLNLIYLVEPSLYISTAYFPKKLLQNLRSPYWSILGPLLFLMYMNDVSGITDYATSRMYADETSMTFTACYIV